MRKEVYNSKDYVVIDEKDRLVGEFDTFEEAEKFITEMGGSMNLTILGPNNK